MTDSEYSTVPLKDSLCNTEPSSVPRVAAFPDYNGDIAMSVKEFLRRIWDFLPFVMFIPYSIFLFLVLPFPALLYRVPIFFVLIMCIVAGIRASFYAQIAREQKLYTYGIAAVATVTSIARNPYSDRYWVQWSYLNGRTGNTPLHKLPASTNIGDQFWVIYDPEYPAQALRWGQFASNGQLDIIDE